MTTVVNAHWTNSAVSGGFATASNWTPTGVPTLSTTTEFDVSIGGSATSGTANFTVASGLNETVGYLNIGANAELEISGGNFQIESQVQTASNLVNYGKLWVGGGSSLSFGAIGAPSQDTASLDNLGSIAVAGSLLLAGPSFELEGAGTLALSGTVAGADSSAITAFTNQNSTIKGSGALGTGQSLQIINAPAGLIDANAGVAMTINTGDEIIQNQGMIETTGAGGLNIKSDMELDGSLKAVGKGALTLIGALAAGGGKASVAAGATLVLNKGQMNLTGSVSIAKGGVIKTTAGDAVLTIGDAVVGDAIECSDIEDAGAIDIFNGTNLSLDGVIKNSGIVNLLGGTLATKIRVFGDGLTIDDAGGVVMSNSANNAIVSNGAQTSLTVDTLVSGAGTIGDGWLSLEINSSGTIKANDAASLNVFISTSNLYYSNNYGTIINSGAGGLVLSGGTLYNSGSVIENGTGALTLRGIEVNGGLIRALSGKIVLQGSSSILVADKQNYLGIATGAVVQTTAGDRDLIYGNVVNLGTLDVAGGSTMYAGGNWKNSASINLGSSTEGATMMLDIELSLANTGTIHMLNSADKITGGSGASFYDESELIEGAGTIGGLNMTVDIETGAKVDATLAGGLTIGANQTSIFYEVQNAGVIQSDTLVTLVGTIDNTGQLIVNTGAKLVAYSVDGTGSTLINGTGTAEFQFVASSDIIFGAMAGGSLILDTIGLTPLYGDIFGLKAGDSIDLRGFAFVAGETQEDTATSAFTQSGGVLYVTNGSSDSSPLHLQGDYTAAMLAADHLAFQFTSDGHVLSGSTDGTLIKLVSTA